MSGKRARRHFSQLSEFERGLIIGIKTAGWSTRCVAGQVDRSDFAVRNCWEQWTREGTHAWKTGSGATRKTTRREDRRIVRQALVDPTVTRSTIREDVGVAIVPQTISRHLAEANLKSKHPFRALPLTPEQPEQMITVYGCGGTLARISVPLKTCLAKRLIEVLPLARVGKMEVSQDNVILSLTLSQDKMTPVNSGVILSLGCGSNVRNPLPIALVPLIQ
ncbi:transposable element Tc1 transposase [Trichonephila clavipes]|uniref:Transposable element Tc1 transposase n=1 Tax=Trichonephila clavipes TaxID=2585209 RepID=A0A8X6V6D0_TRICX|nr:transposable element Tc1 transposase [Trichonephila clavipes]